MEINQSFDVVALGELLIDFTNIGRSESGMRIFEQNPGGAPANVLCSLAKMGAKTAFVGKVGEDIHGSYLRETLNQMNVDTQGLVADPSCFTTLAFVELADNGERKFSFARKPGADTQLNANELPVDLLMKTKIFHFGSLSLTDEPARSATLKAVVIAKSAGAIISFDPNYRPLLWKSRELAVEQMRRVIPFVDIIKISDEETDLLTDFKSPEDASQELLNSGIACVVVTLGKNGALVRTKHGLSQIKPHDCKVVDTTGAGDSFWGGFLYRLAQSEKQPEDLTADEVSDFTVFANAVATLCVQKRGAIPAMPSLEDVQKLYRLGPA
jgi:fructokinase